MESTHDITNSRLLMAYALLIIPIFLAYFLKVKIIRQLVVAALRMTGQLFVVGLALVYFFDLESRVANICWVIAMIVFAALSSINSSDLKIRQFFTPVFSAFFISTSLILVFFNGVLIGLDNIFEARYLIVIGGMLMGNSLKGNIIGISRFYESIKNEELRYLNQIALGANQYEALLPFFRESLTAALKPFIATMATMGLVFLPGMMTGQIIGGEEPIVAIKYQIAIMIAVFVATTLSVTLTIFFSFRQCFNSYGVLKRHIFK